MRVSKEAQRVHLAQTELALAVLRLVNEYDLMPIQVLQALNTVEANILKAETRALDGGER